jgi:8-oxo-dGTP pyrophosphatase MutT (NUDIX family)
MRYGSQAMTSYPRPTKPSSAASLIRDPQGRLLVLKPTYRPEWLMAGGHVEPGESPREACVREIREELGLDLVVGRLLTIDHLGPSNDGVVLAPEEVEQITLQEEELSEWRFVAPEEAEQLLSTPVVRRLRLVLDAAESGETLYLEDGRPAP